MTNIKAEPGSISSGTLLQGDLIKAFLGELGSLDANKEAFYRLEYECEDDTPGWDIDFFIQEIMDELQEYAPEGHYFGAHPGDGADFGFWLEEDF